MAAFFAGRIGFPHIVDVVAATVEAAADLSARLGA